ncbi:ABC transporter permease [Kangiella sediminilitoris]|uniref:Permease n=1 Tax=Kangiella sediminilitoris TaxID=1144748 RepID=A0A1B3BAU8_9GAMM|nr:ABC transporter permease [Kangiella sediminilitoris]AOE49922.1 permease [Kangiella sediminilitoris]
MQTLNLKLWRDLWHVKGQVIAVALVIASGIATLSMALTTVETLQKTSDQYFSDYQFADAFVSAVRVPGSIKERLESIDGVSLVETRIRKYSSLDMPGFKEPVMGLFISIPEESQPRLNQLALRKGRWVERGRSNEIIVNEPFADAHNLAIGDLLPAVMNGKKRFFKVVGIALSPEFIYSVSPGAMMPDNERFGVFWAGRESLEAAYDLQGAFNDATFKFAQGADYQATLKRIDLILEPYGGRNTYLRDDQTSYWFINNEIKQLKTMSTILPTIFLLVSAFLTNIVLSRMIINEREQIGLLKAFGFTNAQVGAHYFKLMLVMCFLGVLIGLVVGSYLGSKNAKIYAEFFRFPVFVYEISVQSFVISTSVSILAALSGTVGSIAKVVKLPPAVAMIPPSPAVYHKTLLDRAGIKAMLDQPTRIAVRQIMRKPLRSFFTVIGVSFAVGLMVMALQWVDAIKFLGTSYYNDAQRQDMTMAFYQNQQKETMLQVERLPGVLEAEPIRYVSVDFINGAKRHRGAITGLPSDATLQPIYDNQKQSTVRLPQGGIVIGSQLAQKLNVGIGDRVYIDFLEQENIQAYFLVIDIFETFLGMPAYTSLDSLNRVLGEQGQFSMLNLLVDPAYYDALYETIKETPAITAVATKQAALDAFNDSIAESMLVMIFVFVVLSSILVFGVTYNMIRVALSERGRELATLRVLGFTKSETSYILLCEIGLLTLMGLILGCFVGWGITFSMGYAMETELFRIPVIIYPDTYSYAVLITLFASFISALFVIKRIHKLNLIEVLKTKE